MLRQLQALRLVVGADALTVKRLRALQHFLVYKPADDLPVLQDERHLARAHFQHRARATPAGAGIAEPGIEEASIVHAELADQGIEGYHLGGIVRRHLHGLLGGENVELVRIEDQAAVRPCLHRLPELTDIIAGTALHIDNSSVALGAIADDYPLPSLPRVRGRVSVGEPGEIDAHRHALADISVVIVDEPLEGVQRTQLLRVEQPIAVPETDLRQPRTLAHEDWKSL